MDYGQVHEGNKIKHTAMIENFNQTGATIYLSKQDTSKTVKNIFQEKLIIVSSYFSQISIFLIKRVIP